MHLTDVLDTRTFDELADAIGDMDVVRRVVREVIDSPVTVDVCVEVVTHAVDSAVLRAVRPPKPVCGGCSPVPWHDWRRRCCPPSKPGWRN